MRAMTRSLLYTFQHTAEWRQEYKRWSKKDLHPSKPWLVHSLRVVMGQIGEKEKAERVEGSNHKSEEEKTLPRQELGDDFSTTLIQYLLSNYYMPWNTPGIDVTHRDTASALMELTIYWKIETWNVQYSYGVMFVTIKKMNQPREHNRKEVWLT